MKPFGFLRAARTVLASLGVAFFVAACGGGGGDPGSSGSGGAATRKASSIDLSSSASALASGASIGTGIEGITITAVVKDAGNVAIPSHPVTFRTNYGTLTVSGDSTNEQGVATAVLIAPSSTSADTRANRDIVITAIAGSAREEIKVQVVGTRLSIAGYSTLSVGDSAQYRVVAQDSAGRAVPGAELAVSAARSPSSLRATTLTTNASGEATFVYVPSSAGTETFTVTGLGATAQMQVTVGSSVLRLDARSTTWRVNQAHAVVATARNNDGSIPPAGTVVRFNTTRGCVYPTTAIEATCVSVLEVPTQADGTAQAWFASPDVGQVMVTAVIGGEVSSVLNADFISVEPSQISVQSTPNSLRTNAFSTGNSSTLEAVVRDAAGNPVQDALVSFSSVTDPSGGRLAEASALTDANGRATTTYYAGPRSSGTNGVRLRASVTTVATATTPSATVSGEVNLTVGGDGLTIALGASNKIEDSPTATTYSVMHTVYVTTSAGAPVGSQPVSVSLRPGSYGVGRLCWNGKIWTRSGATSLNYPNEDLNFNGFRDPGEADHNGDGFLSPGWVANLEAADANGVASGASGPTITVTTDASGFAYFRLKYAKDYANWASMQVQASTRVGGTESVNRMAMAMLAGLADDYTEETVSPPGHVSPFGIDPFGGVGCPALGGTTP